ncbi:AraC family transcriptional regulator [Prevotella sp. 10(H)]|uniref:helix-turn-helix domain-containing protein n=1 Tax=Prevotella sp. 10(H) TaxID=1158294 RepID=UPI0004A6E705|nr:AraC family transcriptional regulator [Prevotella sp. 10(H)]
MQKEHKTLSLKRVADETGNALLKNYIISDSSKFPDYIGLEEAFLFDGLILGVCIKGNGMLKVNHRQYGVKANTITCIFPKNLCTMLKVSDDFLFELMFFSQDYIVSFPLRMDKDILVNMNENPVTEVSKEAIYNILELHSIIIKQHHEDLAFKEDIIKSLIMALMLEIGSYYKIEMDRGILRQSSREDDVAKKFFLLLMEHFRAEKKLAFYADKLCLTPNYLSSIIKKVSGNSFQEWIQIALITEIKKQLKTTDLSILQISEDLNFANPSFFGRFFKQYTGMTPLKYRNS